MRRWIGGLRRSARQPENGSEGKTLILLYHRIDKPRSDPWSLAVTPRYGEEAALRYRRQRAWEEASSPRHALYFPL